MNTQTITKKIDKASFIVGKTWPLYSYVTANPLAGFEDAPFVQAIQKGGNLWGANVLPEAHILRKAWETNQIGNEEIQLLLKQSGRDKTPNYYLNELEKLTSSEEINEYHELDRLTIKWVSLFLDEGMAAWPIPHKEMGFYTAWRGLVIYDKELKKKLGGSIPKSPEEALTRVLANFNEKEQQQIIECHLSALPGWAGFIKYRTENSTIWNNKYPINLLDYLAVRLWMGRCLKSPILPKHQPIKKSSILELNYLWLQAWEKTWQNRFFRKLKKIQPEVSPSNSPDVQLVFCLDTRSEVIRRNLEKQGNYETFGAAGAFGITMNYTHPDTGLINKSSPPMAPSQYNVYEVPLNGEKATVDKYKKKIKKKKAYAYFLKRMKNILPSAFGFVENTGLYYGVFMLIRIISPSYANKWLIQGENEIETTYEPHISPINGNKKKEIPINEKVAIIKGLFDSCGWRKFAPLVVLTGHASHSANNPYASSLDCGACAGNPGKRNARVFAQLANDKDVRQKLRENHDIKIPEKTLFIPAEHITSTDNVELFTKGHTFSKFHRQLITQLHLDLLEVKEAMTKERINEKRNSVATAKVKATSWSESRPEWGLSGHAGYVIGKRQLTKQNTFNDCFLSSYDWTIDKTGNSLKEIMKGPLLVCQWINSHYYFSTVDTNVFGGGSKITLNVTGRYGVIQGNGSDLKRGLPLQSLKTNDDEVFHNPIRLTTLIHAPKSIVEQILSEDSKLKQLIDNKWIHLFVMDPTKGDNIVQL